jgi:hypothetical protein
MKALPVGPRIELVICFPLLAEVLIELNIWLGQVVRYDRATKAWFLVYLGNSTTAQASPMHFLVGVDRTTQWKKAFAKQPAAFTMIAKLVFLCIQIKVVLQYPVDKGRSFLAHN